MIAATHKRPPLPSDDKRWKLLDSAMRRHGYAGHALIESLHTAQDCFGYLDETTMRFVGGCLNVPLSKVYGVATFYNLFQLKPQGQHSCVVCMGTACYIKKAGQLLKQIEEKYSVTAGQTTTDRRMSVLTARCLGSCGLAPAAVLDGEVCGNFKAQEILQRIEKWMAENDA